MHVRDSLSSSCNRFCFEKVKSREPHKTVKPRERESPFGFSHEQVANSVSVSSKCAKAARRNPSLSELFIILLSLRRAATLSSPPFLPVPPPLFPIVVPPLYVHPPQSSSAAILRLCLLNFIYSNPARLLKVTSTKRKGNGRDGVSRAAQKLNS